MPGRGAAGQGSMTGPHCRCRDAIRTTELRPPGIGKNTFGSREDLRRGAWRRVSSGRWRTRVGAVHANARRRCGQTPAARHGLRAPASGFGIGAVSSVGDVGADAAPLGRHPGGKPQRAGGGRYGAIGIVALGERDAAGAARARGETGPDGRSRPAAEGRGGDSEGPWQAFRHGRRNAGSRGGRWPWLAWVPPIGQKKRPVKGANRMES